jgi:sigma-B regulation protein RsbU (phosphoserine phosphatase)
MFGEAGDLRGIIETTQVVNERVEAMEKIRGLLRDASLRNQELTEWHRTMEVELNVARQIQRALIPQHPLCRPGICFEFLYEPSGTVGGDLYDVIPLDGDRTGILIADASGHGVGAAFIAVMIEILFRSPDVDKGSPRAALATVNGQLRQVVPEGQFATAFYGVFDAASGALRFTRAGHPKPMLLRHGADDVELLDTDGFVLGTLDEIALEERTVALEPGDRLLYYTDGIVEAAGGQGERYGVDRLRDVFGSAGSLARAELLERIVADVRRFAEGNPIADDIAIVIAEATDAGTKAGRNAPLDTRHSTLDTRHSEL